MRGDRWPAMIKIDAQEGTYAANIGGRVRHVVTKTDCVRFDGKKRSEQHTKTAAKFLPEEIRQGGPTRSRSSGAARMPPRAAGASRTARRCSPACCTVAW